MMAVLLMTWVAGVMMYMETGTDAMPMMHIGLGLAVLLLVLIVALTGTLANKLRTMPRIPPLVVTTTNKIHRFAGWLILLSTFVQLVTTLANPQLILVILIDTASYLGFYLLKYKFKS